MRTGKLITSLVLGAGLLAGGLALASDGRSSSSSATTMSAGETWLSIPQLHDRLVAEGYSDFEEIERERDHYEVTLTDPEGRRVELYVDGVTGEIIKTEVKRQKRSDDRRDSDERRDTNNARDRSSD